MEQDAIKKRIEQYVLSALIYDSKCMYALDYLSYKNFGVYLEADHQIIYKCISEMFMKKDIDLATIAYELKTKYNKDYLNYLIELTYFVSSSENTEYHSLIIVQMDFVNKFCNMLDKLTNSSLIPLNEKVLISDCSKDIRIGDLDIFESISGFIRMAKHKNMSQVVIDESIKFETKIGVRIKAIKEKRASMQLMKHLEVLCKTPKQKKLLFLLKRALK
jgi:hypothetical protein